MDLFRTPPHRHVEVPGAEVAVRTVGTGPDVLLVHGWPLSGATWRHLLPHLTEHLRCHVVDLPGAGDSRFDRRTPISVTAHAEAVRRVVDALDLDDVAVVGQDSGGLIARHALAGDPRVRAWGLVETEQPQGGSLKFRTFLLPARVPSFEVPLVRLLGTRLKRSRLVLGDCFEDRDLLDGEFDELFLRPVRTDPERRWALGEFGRRFDLGTLRALGELHRRIEVPVQLVYAATPTFFPLRWTREMTRSFGHPAELTLVPGARLLAHEERPAEVAAALLPVLSGARVA